jgi:hypothetical protein
MLVVPVLSPALLPGGNAASPAAVLLPAALLLPRHCLLPGTLWLFLFTGLLRDRSALRLRPWLLGLLDALLRRTGGLDALLLPWSGLAAPLLLRRRLLLSSTRLRAGRLFLRATLLRGWRRLWLPPALLLFILTLFLVSRTSLRVGGDNRRNEQK